MKYANAIIPLEIRDQLRELGLRLRAARTRRKLRQADLAQQAGLSRTAIVAVERGEPTTGLGTYLRVLWALGLNREIDLLADPGLDRDGLALEWSAQSQRVGVARRASNDF
ncbi:MAG: helix-turn-helix domain-containing protein [Betaproteobacteria bacterium]